MSRKQGGVEIYLHFPTKQFEKNKMSSIMLNSTIFLVTEINTIPQKVIISSCVCSSAALGVLPENKHVTPSFLPPFPFL